MKTLITKNKSELKAQAQIIRNLKAKRKSSSNGYVSGLFTEQWHYRHKHVAYCIMRGRELAQIEQKVRPGNELSESLLEKYLKEYSDEVVCACM